MLTRVSMVLFAVLAAWQAEATAMNTAILVVPPGALHFVDGAAGLDDTGGFSLTITLKGLPVRAKHCDKQGMMAQMPATPPTGDSLTLNDAQKAVAAKKLAYYRAIKAASDAGKPISLHLINTPTYLYEKGGLIYAPYCGVTLDDRWLTIATVQRSDAAAAQPDAADVAAHTHA